MLLLYTPNLHEITFVIDFVDWLFLLVAVSFLNLNECLGYINSNF